MMQYTQPALMSKNFVLPILENASEPTHRRSKILMVFGLTLVFVVSLAFTQNAPSESSMIHTSTSLQQLDLDGRV